MRDPLAPDGNDPYSFLGVPSDCTPAAAEAAMDAYNERSPGREMEATEAWDALRDPVKRLVIDVLRYQPQDPRQDIPRACAAAVAEAAGRLTSAIDALVRGLDFGPAKTLLDLPECERPDDDES